MKEKKCSHGGTLEKNNKERRDLWKAEMSTLYVQLTPHSIVLADFSLKALFIISEIFLQQSIANHIEIYVCIIHNLHITKKHGSMKATRKYCEFGASLSTLALCFR